MNGGQPYLAGVLPGWQSLQVLKVLTQSVDENGMVVVTSRSFRFIGSIQPYRPEAIQFDPAGQRAWEWLKIYTTRAERPPNPTDRVVWKGKPYKIMDMRDWSQNGYMEYTLCRDYGHESEAIKNA